MTDDFSNIVWAVPLKSENSQTITNYFETILRASNRKPNLIETDRDKEFLIKSFTDFFKSKQYWKI